MELATVKKGTPLYGQPAWWGDDADSPEAGKGRSRPDSLSLSTEPVDAGQSPGSGAAENIMEQQPRGTYMEIPFRDDDDDLETPVVGGKIGKNSTTDNYMIMSKDSLSPENKSINGKAMDSPSTEKNPATSFTIDLDEDQPRKKNMNASLSECVPQKLRRGFRERKDRVGSRSSKESTPTKNSEERELSPLQQRKIDDLWSTVEAKSKVSRLSSIQATLNSSSLRSPNLEDIDLLSEFSDRSKSTEKDGERKVRRSLGSKSPQQKPKSPRLRGKPSFSSSSSSSNPVPSSKPSTLSPVSYSQYSNPTSYLIDKMFEGGHQNSTSPSSKETSPEQKLYKEAASHDKTRSDKKPSSDLIKSTDPTKSTELSKYQKATGKREESESKCDGDDLKITEETTPLRKEDKEDKVSEAGTYTIEAEGKNDSDEEDARKRIDEVFGVDIDSFEDGSNIDPERMASPGGYDNVRDGDKTPLDTARPFPSLSSPGDIDDLVLGDDDDGEVPGMTTGDGVQTWVSQLTALTSHKADHARPGHPDTGTSSLSKKPPQAVNPKRRGTGRKLPTIPGQPVQSPDSSEHSSCPGDQSDLHIVDDRVSPARNSDIVINGKAKEISVTNNTSGANGTTVKATRISSQSSRNRTNGDSNGAPLDDSPCSTSRSRGSVDTELLLQDTETVMAAMEARMKRGKARGDSPGNNSDTDVSSTIGVVNGDDDFVKPSLYKSPRDALSKRNGKDVGGKNGTSGVSSTTPVFSKRNIGRSHSQTLASKTKIVSSPRSAASVTKKSVVSDVLSRADSAADNDSTFSDIGSDVGDNSFSRNGSKGKGSGNMSMTKPNRAFQLRRSRAESFEEPTTPRTAKSTGRSNATGSSVRSSSVHSTVRRSGLETQRSDASSLGANIVRKSRENSAMRGDSKAKTANNLVRADGGRHSLRLERASSLSLPKSGRKEMTLKTSNGVNNSRGNLAVTGVSSSRNQPSSQPNSRSNTPKSAERMAWKRRKEYDPRRAVAEAKAKVSGNTSSVSSAPTSVASSTTVSTRPKPSAKDNSKRRMIRSASFTNTAELSLSAKATAMSNQELASAENKEPEGFRRAFMPFHNSLRTNRSAYSEDEDDSILSTASTQTSYDTLIVSSIYQLSQKLKAATDKTMFRLREEDRVNLTPSPMDDFLSDSGKSEITAWKSANQELAGVLKNLRKIERHVLMMDRVLFPEDDCDTDVSSGLRVGQNYVHEIERIRNEIKGFQPIEPYDQEIASPEMAELSEQF